MALFGALVVAGSVLGLAAPALAHNYEISSVPENGAVVTTLPKEFSITTNDVLLNLGGKGRGFAMEVRGPDGLYYGDGCVEVKGPSILTNAAVGGPGTYTIRWQLISTDGHGLSGTQKFTWQPATDTTASQSASASPDASASPSAPVSTGSATPPDCHGTQSGSASAAPDLSGPPDARNSEVPLNDVLWIGGAIVLVGLAGVVTLLVVTRGKKKGSRPAE